MNTSSIDEHEQGIKMNQISDRQLDRTSVLVADDHVLLAESVASALSAPPREFRTQIVATFDETCAALVSGVHFDLVMLDLKMPGMLGLKSVKDVMAAAQGTPVVLMSGSADLALVRSAIDSGARGLIPKSLSLRSLVSVVDVVLSGQIFMPAEMLGESKKRPGVGISLLAEREVSIMQLASEGRTNKEIALALGLTEVTIKMHMRGICRKLDARNRAHAVNICKEMDLL